MATPDLTRSGGSTAAGSGRASFGRRLATETKHAIKTTEFYVLLAVIAGLLIAGNVIEKAEGGIDYFAADKVWLYITILASAYMVSRGLAKSGSSEPYSSETGKNHAGDGDSNGR